MNAPPGRRLKVLFLAYYFRPVQTSASVRTWNIAKYLARSGWDVIVVTPDPLVWRNVDDLEQVGKELDQEGVRRVLTGHRWRCLDPVHLKCWNEGMGWVLGGLCRMISRHLGIDKGAGWIRQAEQACASLAPENIDLILASGKPFASFILAKRLSCKLGCPYVLDYRDPWSSGENNQHSARMTISPEEGIIATCAAVTTVSKSLLEPLSLSSSKIHVITNGFDPEEMARVEPYEFGHFAIVYAGIFYPPQRVISPIMKALAAVKATMIHQRIPWQFHYYGPQGDHVHAEAQRFGVEDKVQLHGTVTRAEALSAIYGSGVSIVITSVHDECTADKGTVTAKLFDSLGLSVPVLVIAPHGSDVKEIVDTAGLCQVVKGSDTSRMVLFLLGVISGERPKAQCRETYAWPNIVQRLDEVLRQATQSSLMTVRRV
jgi:glycosyltransferase involved in cell wall biosynthesis